MELLGFGNVAFSKKEDIGNQIKAHAEAGRLDVIANALHQASSVAVAKTAKGKRAAMVAYMSQLPEEIRLGLQGAPGHSRLRMTDTKQLYFTRAAGSSSTIKIIRNDDKKAAGITNVSDAKLDKDKPFLVTGIQLLSGIAGAGATDCYSVAFGVADKSIVNGDFKFAINSQAICEDATCQVFATGDVLGTLPGYYPLDNAILITGDKEIEFTLSLPKNCPADTWVKLVLHGVAIVPAGV